MSKNVKTKPSKTFIKVSAAVEALLEAMPNTMQGAQFNVTAWRTNFDLPKSLGKRQMLSMIDEVLKQLDIYAKYGAWTVSQILHPHCQLSRIPDAVLLSTKTKADAVPTVQLFAAPESAAYVVKAAVITKAKKASKAKDPKKADAEKVAAIFNDPAQHQGLANAVADALHTAATPFYEKSLSEVVVSAAAKSVKGKKVKPAKIKAKFAGEATGAQ